MYNQLIAKGKACIHPGFLFCPKKFSQEFHHLVHAFKSARSCCPVQVQELHPTADTLQELRNFDFLDNDVVINGLINELPRYLANAHSHQISCVHQNYPTGF